MGFIVHFIVYLAVNSFRVLTWHTTGGLRTYRWFRVPMGGWGIGVVGHFVAVFAGGGDADRVVQREYERLEHLGP